VWLRIKFKNDTFFVLSSLTTINSSAFQTVKGIPLKTTKVIGLIKYEKTKVIGLEMPPSESALIKIHLN